MIEKNDIYNHPTVQLTTRVSDVCAPLFNYFDVDQFSYVRLFPDGSRSVLSTNVDGLIYDALNNTKLGIPPQLFYEDFITDEYLNGSKSFNFHSDLKPFYLSHSYLYHYANFLEHVGIKERFCMIRKNNDLLELFVFSMKRNNIDKSYLLSNLDLLQQFIVFFRNTLQSEIKLIDSDPVCLPCRAPNIYNEKMKVLMINQRKRESFINDMTPNRFHFDSTNSYLTNREFGVLTKMTMGESTKRIANSLGIKPRTVNTHIENIKRKLDRHNREDLVKLFLADYKEIL